MKQKELKRRLDNSANYIWDRDAQGYWRLKNAVTLKTACGCENRYTAEQMTKKLRQDGYSVEDLPNDSEIKSAMNALQTAAAAILLLAGPVLWLLEVYGIF